jgi:flagellar biosynthesis/type III secretory pathway protein FliH
MSSSDRWLPGIAGADTVRPLAASDAQAWIPAAIPAAGEAFVGGAAVTPLLAVDAAPALPGFVSLLEDFGGPAASPVRGGRPAARAMLTPAEAAARAARAAQEAAARERQAREDAERQALARAEAEEAARQQALADAWAEGEAAGRAAAEQELHATFAEAYATLVAAVDTVREHEERWVGNLEENVAALAVSIARHLVGHEARLDATLVTTLAARAVAEFPVDEPLAVRAHPEDLDALRAVGGAGTGLPADAPARALRWLPDARLARGGVLVEGRERIVDGRVDAALERIYRTLAQHHA